MLFAAPAAAQTLFKCVQPNGRVIYQQEKCDDRHKQSTVRAPDPVANKTEAELRSASDKEARVAELQMGQVAQVLADVSLCASNAPGWDEKNAGLVQDWKARNGTQVAKFDQDAEARARAIARVESERARLTADKSGKALADRCESVAASLRGGPATAPKK
ncbi:MAG TPA: DUF4124 domain-containing protein [Usitatibacter sp.]|nr:DUF4124 domain-containing protein [Usitatibacter sp.]